MNITSAQYVAENGENVTIKAVVDGHEVFVPITEGNRHYDEIIQQVAEGTLTIADAE